MTGTVPIGIFFKKKWKYVKEELGDPRRRLILFRRSATDFLVLAANAICLVRNG